MTCRQNDEARHQIRLSGRPICHSGWASRLTCVKSCDMCNPHDDGEMSVELRLRPRRSLRLAADDAAALSYLALVILVREVLLADVKAGVVAAAAAHGACACSSEGRRETCRRQFVRGEGDAGTGWHANSLFYKPHLPWTQLWPRPRPPLTQLRPRPRQTWTRLWPRPRQHPAS